MSLSCSRIRRAAFLITKKRQFLNAPVSARLQVWRYLFRLRAIPWRRWSCARPQRQRRVRTCSTCRGCSTAGSTPKSSRGRGELLVGLLARNIGGDVRNGGRAFLSRCPRPWRSGPSPTRRWSAVKIDLEK